MCHLLSPRSSSRNSWVVPRVSVLWLWRIVLERRVGVSLTQDNILLHAALQCELLELGTQCMFGCVNSNSSHCTAALHMCRRSLCGGEAASVTPCCQSARLVTRGSSEAELLGHYKHVTSLSPYLRLILTCHFTDAMSPSYLQWLTLLTLLHKQLFRTHFRPPFLRSLWGDGALFLLLVNGQSC